LLFFYNLLISLKGFGTYSFIPDSSFVGTIFINNLSNLLVTAGNNAYLILEPLNGNSIDSSIPPLNTYHSTKLPEGGIKLRIGTMQYGQTKDIVLPMAFGYSIPYLKATLEYTDAVTGVQEKNSVEGMDRGDSEVIEIQLLRLQVVDGVRRAMTKLKSDRDAAQGIIRELIQKINSSKVADAELVEDILKDLEGEVTEALSKEEHFDKWGKHYLPSLLGAHLHQQCNNFKDPGVQHYGGALFEELRYVILF
jgi:hypothetical protein